ncbi:fibronectin type-III domain-containing protein 3a isoform X3 [Aethina tumida]|nr:fibronectin type-III domain-containing protein 3a isoform X3 [Aethina tumida]
MVSTNSSPPIAMPVQVPPGHMVQQIVDENGTLRHVILSPQPPPPGLVPLPGQHSPNHFGAGPANGTTRNQQFYSTIPAGNFPPQPPHFHSNLQQHPIPNQPGHLSHSPPPPPNYYKDERTQRQHNKLKKKLHEKQQQKGDAAGVGVSPRKDLVNGLKRGKEKGGGEDGEDSVGDEDDLVQVITDVLSSVQPPTVSELSSRSALLQWGQPMKQSEAASSDTPLDITEQDLRYEILLSDKSKEMKFKSIYSGTSLSCRIQDLRPGQEYSVCLQVHLHEMQGSATDPTKFTTPPCEPDQPQVPKIVSRTKNSLQLKWNAVNDNGSHIQHYILEYAEANNPEFTVIKIKSKTHSLQKLQPATVYKFRLGAVNAVGRSAYSEIVSYSTHDNPPTKPNPPTLVEAGVDSLHLSWQCRPKDDEFILQKNNPKTGHGFLAEYNGHETTHICRNLQHYQEYRFRLCVKNESGTSGWSDDVTFYTLPARPARPSKPVVKGRIHAHSFKLKWEPPSDKGGADISSYILEVNSGSGYQIVYRGAETEAVCDNLNPGTTYQLRVSCISEGGQSDYSDPCTVTTDAISPGCCDNLELNGKPKSNSISVRWGEPAYNGGAPILEYEVEVVSPKGSQQNLVQKNKETQCVATDLNPGCEYSFRVRAVNRIGPGVWTDYLRVTSGPAPPEIPEITHLQCKSAFQACCEWREPPTNGSPITEYRLEISPVNEDCFTLIYQGPELRHDLKNLTPFTKYFVRLQACNVAGCSGYASAATLTPAAPPAAVTNIRSESTPTSIILNWAPPLDNGSPILYYNIEFLDRIIQTDGPKTSHVLENLHPDTMYKLKVQAVNNVAPGVLSSTVRTSTLKLPPAAPKLECVATGHNYLKLKWGEGKNTDYTLYCIEMINHRSNEYQCVYKGTSLTCKVNKLHELTPYKFRINATNDAGVGPFSDDVEFQTTISPPALLKSPKVVEVDQHSCVLEWTAAKNVFPDQVEYCIQFASVKEPTFVQGYRGTKTSCSLENLQPGCEYQAKVCPIRLTNTGDELPGPYSPVLNFSTLANEAEPSKVPTPLTQTPQHQNVKQRTLIQTIQQSIKHKSLTVQQKVLVISVMFTVLGLVMSMIILCAIDM